MKHYFDCKSRAPDMTSACIVVSKHYGRRYSFCRTMKSMRSCKSNLFCPTACCAAECRYDGLTGLVDIWSDPPDELKVNSAFPSLQTFAHFDEKDFKKC